MICYGIKPGSGSMSEGVRQVIVEVSIKLEGGPNFVVANGKHEEVLAYCDAQLWLRPGKAMFSRYMLVLGAIVRAYRDSSRVLLGGAYVIV